MAFTRPTLDTIYNRIKADMESRVSSGVRIPRFSLLGVMAIVFAGAVHLLYGYLEFISKQLFVDTAETEYLDRLANIYGLPRKAAVYATGQVTFTGVDTTVIPEGTKLQNSQGILYSTVSEVTISGGSVLADVQSDTEGAAGNNTDSSLFLLAPITDVDTEAVVTTTIEGGQDQETDEELRGRLLQRLQNPPASGTKSDYERWALSVTGVGKAWVLAAEEYAGAGSVGVIISTSTLDPVSAQTKQDVIDYIDSVKPIGANVDVLDVVPVLTDYDISIDPNILEIQQNVDQNLETLHLAEASPGGTILLSHVRSAVASSGMTDYVITDIRLDTISIGVQNITTTGFEVAKFNSVTYSPL